MSIGGVDIGQGTLTAMAQLAAEGLGVKVDDVRVNTVDTDYSPYEWQTVASRLTWSMGNAVLREPSGDRHAAASPADRQPGLGRGHRRSGHRGRAGHQLPHRGVAAAEEYAVVYAAARRPDGTWTGGPVLAQGRFMPEYVTPLDPETGQGQRAVVHFTTGAQAVEVEVGHRDGRGAGAEDRFGL